MKGDSSGQNGAVYWSSNGKERRSGGRERFAWKFIACDSANSFRVKARPQLG